MAASSTRLPARNTERANAAIAEETGASTRASRLLDLSGRAVLLATDGSPGAIAGACVAQELARRYHAAIHVVSVVDTRGTAVPPPLDLALAMGDAVVGTSVRAEQTEAVRARIAAEIGERVDWPVRVKLGTPATSIVNDAQRVGAVLIVMGLRHHSRLDRAVHDETTLNVIRHAACPVLGVTEETRALPTRILIAMDFSEASVIATRTAESIAGEHPVVVLAYVARRGALALEEGEAVVHELGVGAAFARVEQDLMKDDVTFEHIVLHQATERTTAESLLEHADSARCDLIAAGSVRRGRLDRWRMGSVSRDLVRDGRRSVLIAPPARDRTDQ